MVFELSVLERENLYLAGVDLLLCDGVAQRGPVPFVGLFERSDFFVEGGHSGGCGALGTDPVVELIAQIGVSVREVPALQSGLGHERLHGEFAVRADGVPIEQAGHGVADQAALGIVDIRVRSTSGAVTGRLWSCSTCTGSNRSRRCVSLTCMDNGPELTADALRDWCHTSGINTAYIEPGSPWENGHIESFNGRLRDECLNIEDFANLIEARVVIED